MSAVYDVPVRVTREPAVERDGVGDPNRGDDFLQPDGFEVGFGKPSTLIRSGGSIPIVSTFKKDRMFAYVIWGRR